MPERLLSVQEVADLLGIPPSTLYQWFYRNEKLVGGRIGRRLRYRPADVQAFIDAQFAVREGEATTAAESADARAAQKGGGRGS